MSVRIDFTEDANRAYDRVMAKRNGFLSLAKAVRNIGSQPESKMAVAEMIISEGLSKVRDAVHEYIYFCSRYGNTPNLPAFLEPVVLIRECIRMAETILGNKCTFRFTDNAPDVTGIICDKAFFARAFYMTVAAAMENGANEINVTFLHLNGPDKKGERHVFAVSSNGRGLDTATVKYLNSPTHTADEKAIYAESTYEYEVLSYASVCAGGEAVFHDRDHFGADIRLSLCCGVPKPILKRNAKISVPLNDIAAEELATVR